MDMIQIPQEIIHFFNEDGQLKSWPAKRRKKLHAIAYLAEKFEDGREYSEKEVNQLLNEWHTFEDAALLRRELFENRRLNRTVDGSAYWKEQK
ncbi:MAG TPA: DUF2087 domain-containing protein [Bacillaceae bacterium]